MPQMPQALRNLFDRREDQLQSARLHFFGVVGGVCVEISPSPPPFDGAKHLYKSVFSVTRAKHWVSQWGETKLPLFRSRFHPMKCVTPLTDFHYGGRSPGSALFPWYWNCRVYKGRLVSQLVGILSRVNHWGLHHGYADEEEEEHWMNEYSKGHVKGSTCRWALNMLSVGVTDYYFFFFLII